MATCERNVTFVAWILLRSNDVLWVRSCFVVHLFSMFIHFDHSHTYYSCRWFNESTSSPWVISFADFLFCDFSFSLCSIALLHAHNSFVLNALAVPLCSTLPSVFVLSAQIIYQSQTKFAHRPLSECFLRLISTRSRKYFILAHTAHKHTRTTIILLFCCW